MPDTMKRIDGIIVDDDIERCPVSHCQHCGADLSVGGVHGYNSVDFMAEPFSVDEPEYYDSWRTKFEQPIDGALIRCSECNEVIQMAGCYGRAWFYQNLADEAVSLLDFLIRNDLLVGDTLDEARRLAYDQDVYDKKPAFVPVDGDGNGYGTFPDSKSAAEEAVKLGLDTVLETAILVDEDFNLGNKE